MNLINIDGLTELEKEQLNLLLAEAKNRGLKLPVAKLPKNKKWPIASNGYFTSYDGKIYNPSAQQKAFVDSTSAFSIFDGSRGSGKTSAGAQKSLLKISQGESGIVMNPDFENLKISTWPEFRNWIPWDMVIPRQRYRGRSDWQPEKPFRLNFINGAWCIIKGVKDPDSARGPNVNWLWFDESEKDETGASWQTAVASVRVGKTPQKWATATPAGQDHWQYRFFHLLEIPEDAVKVYEELNTGQPFVESFHGNIYDNQHNLDPVFFASVLAAYPAGWLRQQEVFGEYVQRTGALGDRTWFNGKILSALPPDGIYKKVRFWDLAATEKKISGPKANDPDETVGAKVYHQDPYFYLVNQVGGFWDYDDIVKNIISVATIDGPDVKIYIEQEPGSGGKNQIAAISKEIKAVLPGHTVEGHESKKDGDKVMRANVWFAEAKAGYWFIINTGEWVEPFLSQLGCFGICRHDDKIDAVSGARHVIAPIRRWRNIPYLHL